VKRSSIGLSLIANQVLKYLISRPGAQDTIEGIMAWWLPGLRIEPAVAEVEAALGALVAGKYVLRREGSDGRIHYRMNQEKELAIRRRLRGRLAPSRQRATRTSPASRNHGAPDP
jgi:hypothetical protein